MIFRFELIQHPHEFQISNFCPRPVLVGLVLCVLLPTFFSYISRRKKTSIQHQLPPMSPKGLFQLIKELASTEAPLHALETLKQMNTMTYRSKLGLTVGLHTIVVGDAKTTRKILNDPITKKPRQVYGRLDDVTSGYMSLITSDGGAEWHRRRKGMSTAFSSKHIRRMNKVAMQKINTWIDTRLSKFIENDEAFDVGEEMNRIILAALTETAFQYEMSNEEGEEYKKELEYSLKEFASKSLANPLRKPFGIFLSDRRRAHQGSKYITNLSLKIMESYRKLQNPIKETLIDCIMTNPTYKSDMERAADITATMIAGHDTTAYTLAWVLRELARAPKEQEKLRLSLEAMGEDAWDKSPVLRNAVREAMRLYPVLGKGVTRIIGRDFVTSEGYLLPKGSLLFLPFITALRNPDVFEKADSFIPSRWENATKEMNESFYPFAMGKQNCIGQSLVNAEIHTIVPRICCEFELEVVDEGRPESFLTWKPLKTMLKVKRVTKHE